MNKEVVGFSLRRYFCMNKPRRRDFTEYDRQWYDEHAWARTGWQTRWQVAEQRVSEARRIQKQPEIPLPSHTKLPSPHHFASSVPIIALDISPLSRGLVLRSHRCQRQPRISRLSGSSALQFAHVPVPGATIHLSSPCAPVGKCFEEGPWMINGV